LAAGLLCGRAAGIGIDVARKLYERRRRVERCAEQGGTLLACAFALGLGIRAPRLDVDELGIAGDQADGLGEPEEDRDVRCRGGRDESERCHEERRKESLAADGSMR
jgi:hypothetical protein